jgi:hypothetical protein
VREQLQQLVKFYDVPVMKRNSKLKMSEKIEIEHVRKKLTCHPEPNQAQACLRPSPFSLHRAAEKFRDHTWRASVPFECAGEPVRSR